MTKIVFEIDATFHGDIGRADLDHIYAGLKWVIKDCGGNPGKVRHYDRIRETAPLNLGEQLMLERVDL